MDTEKIFRKKTLAWYEKHGRNFYWRRYDLSLFKVLVLEILLRKTRAEKVDEMIEDFFDEYPDFQSIHEADDEDIKRMIKGLGLQNVRTKTLKSVSASVVRKAGDLSIDDIKNVRGIGRYIINAVSCFAQNERVPIVDSNVARVFSRYFDVEVKKEIGKDEQIWNFAEKLLPKKDFKKFNWALIDMGALICGRDPQCDICPLESTCEHVNQ